MSTTTVYTSRDAYMGLVDDSSNFSGWNGRELHIPIGRWKVGANFANVKSRGLLYFNIDFTGWTALNSATLYVVEAAQVPNNNQHAGVNGDGSTFKINRMIKDWGQGSDIGEGNLNANMGWTWNSRFDQYTTSDESSISIIMNGSVLNPAESSGDVTAMVRSWWQGANNYGLMIRSTSEGRTNASADASAMIWAQEAGTDKRAYIVIDYTTNIAPNAPTLNAPINESVQGSLTPTFSGVSNDPDAGDYITAVQVQVAPAGNRMIYSSTITAPPSSGQVRFSSTNLASAATMWISKTDADSKSLPSVTALQYFRIEDKNDVTHWITVDPTTITDSGTYYTFAITAVNFALPTTFVNAQEVYFIIDTASNNDVFGTMSWDSGSILKTGTPVSFSDIYGESGIPKALSTGYLYKWRAKTRDKGLAWSPWSSAGWFRVNSTPNVPTVVIAPTPLSDVADNTPTITITHNDPDPSDTLMYGYSIVVEKVLDSTSGWSSGLVDTTGSPVHSKAVDSGVLDWGVEYQVKAKTKDAYGAWSSFSAWQKFTTHIAGAPITLSPTGNATTSVTPTFSGVRASLADLITGYEIIVYNQAGTAIWTSGVLTTGITGGSSFSKLYPNAALTASAYYSWKVRVTATVGASGASSVSDWSAPQAFRIVDAAVPSPSSPTGSIATLTPTFTGSRVDTFAAPNGRVQVQLYPATATEDILGASIWDSGTKASGNAGVTISAGGLGTQFTVVYGTAVGTPATAPTLAYSTTYKWRASVSADATPTWSAWSGLVTFTTESAGMANLTSVGGTDGSSNVGEKIPWVTTSTPAFLITSSGSETIDKAQIRIWSSSSNPVILWNSGLVNVTDATTATITSGITLNPGRYQWDAIYQKAVNGPSSPSFSDKKSFRINAPPDSPSNLFPEPAHVFRDDEPVIFRAEFSDSDVSTMLDTPSLWEIVISRVDGVTTGGLPLTKSVTTNLRTGAQSEYTYSDAYVLLSNIDYKFKTRFTDSKSAVGTYSGENVFSIAGAPDGNLTSPLSGSALSPDTLTTVTPIVTWNYVGGVQQSFRLFITEVDSAGNRITDAYDSGTKTTATPSFQMPGGYLRPSGRYRFALTVRNTNGLDDPIPSIGYGKIVIDGPDPIQNVYSVTYADISMLEFHWDIGQIKAGQTFVSYNIYRRVSGDINWTLVDKISPRIITSYRYWYAGHGLPYQYRITITTIKTGVGIELESDDSSG